MSALADYGWLSRYAAGKLIVRYVARVGGHLPGGERRELRRRRRTLKRYRAPRHTRR